MKRNVFYFIVSLIIFYTSTYSQSFWDLSPGLMDYQMTGFDTTAEGLKALIRSRPGYEYYGPLRLLAYHHYATERSFILDSMKIFASQGLSRYYSYQYIRGYLGDPGAFVGMDTCAIMMGMGSERLNAIRLLAKNGYFNHFDKVQAAIPQKDFTWDAIYCVAAYANSPVYREQCKSLLASVINDTSQYGSEVSLAAEKLSILDKPYASSLLLSRFIISDFRTRFIIYNHMNNIDPELKVEMSKIALMTESIDNTDRFVPSFYAGIVRDPEDPSGYVSGDSKKFLEPSYIKFLKDFMAQQPPQVAKWRIGWFLHEFIPLPETTLVLNLLDTLISTKQQVASYGWIGDQNFVYELNSYLTNARTYLTSGDSSNCASQIFTFQKIVDKEYRDSLDGDTRYINREGWKFLFYNAKYILERLSE